MACSVRALRSSVLLAVLLAVPGVARAQDAAVSEADASALLAPVAVPAPTAQVLPAPERAVTQPASAGTPWSATAPRTLSLVGAPGRGVTLQTDDDFFALTLRGRIQVRDSVVAPSIGAVTNEINVRTLRVLFSGHVLSRNVQFNVQLAFGPQDYEANMVSPLFDAWASFTHLRDLSVRVGQFFVPFDRARTNAEWGLNMIDRPLVIAEATLDRDVGVELSSNDLGGLGLLAYRLGVFGGEGKNRLASSPGFLYVARLQANPFGAFDDSVEGDQHRVRRPRLAVGVAGAFNHQSQRQRSTQGSTYQLGTFDYAHAAADVTFKYAGLYLFGEALYRQGLADSRTGMTAAMPSAMLTEYSRSTAGYVFQAGMMLVSRLELVARWEQSFALGMTDPTLVAQLRTQGSQLGAGLNWYQDGHGFKVQADYHYIFGDVVAQGRHQARVQVQLSF